VENILFLARTAIRGFHRLFSLLLFWARMAIIAIVGLVAVGGFLAESWAD
jgi:hypothetical protein